MSHFYESISDLTEYENYKKVFWKFYICFFKKYSNYLKKNDCESEQISKLIFYFNNSILRRCVPWPFIREKIEKALLVEGELDDSVFKPMAYMYSFYAHFHKPDKNMYNLTLNIHMTEVECFLILFLFAISEETTPTDFLYLMYICSIVNGNEDFTSMLKNTFMFYFSKKASNLRELIDIYVSYLENIVNMEYEQLLAGIYNDIIKKFEIEEEYALEIESIDDFEESINELVSEECLKVEQVKNYFMQRIYKNCRLSVSSIDKKEFKVDNVTIYNNNIKKLDFENVKDSVEDSLACIFGIYKFYNVKQLYSIEEIQKSSDYKLFFSKTKKKIENRGITKFESSSTD